jgi:hypothetical protein
MNLKQLKEAFKNADKITAGVINTIFKRKEVEAIAEARFKICQECHMLDNQGDKCFAPGTQPCCGDCGCSLSFKTRSLSSACPLGKWEAWLTDEQEEQLKL